MKKLSLKDLKLNASNVLQRDQLKNVFGGGDLIDLNGDPIAGGGVNSNCYCNDGSIEDIEDTCQWCHLACMNRGGYKGVCIEW